MSEFDLNTVFPGWETDGILGSGVFGTVYLAHSLVDGKPVYGAVKVIKTPPTPQAVENAIKMGISKDLLQTYFTKFKNDLNWELTMFRTVNSTNLVKVDAIAVEDMPDAGWTGYIRTGVFTPMTAYFDKVTSTPEDAARLGAELSSALQACSEYGMVHGDITPGNVMVSDAGTFLLSDFGIRRVLKKAGTALYGITDSEFEAPEISDEQKYTHASDIYSLGALMCWVANGGKMPEGKNPDNIAGMDKKLAAIIKKATAEDPAERYQSAADMRAELCKLEIYTKRRPQRRAVAAACAFDLVKRNGSSIAAPAAAEKTEQVPAEKKEPTPAAKPEIKPAPAAQTAKKFNKKTLLLVVIGFIALAGIVALLVLNPFGTDETPGGTGDNTGSQGGQVTPENPDTPDTPDTPDDTDNTDTPDTPDDGNKPNDPNTGDNTGTDDPGTGNKPEDPDTGDDPGTTDDPNTGDDPGTGDDPVDPGMNVLPSVDENGYMLPTDTELITAADLEGLGDYQSYMVLNEIYARHGKIFKSEDIQSYFEGQDWYTPVTSDSSECEAKFSATERANMATIIQYQKDMGYRPGGNTQPKPDDKPDEPVTPPDTPDTPDVPDEPDTPVVEPTNDDHLFPSDTELLTYADMEGMSLSETRMLINEIYARHGKIFTSDTVQAYFDSQVWYSRVTASYAECEAKFNATEWANIDTILAYQKDAGLVD